MGRPLLNIFTKGQVIEVQNTQLSIPSFSLVAPWVGVSQLIAQFPIGNGGRNISLNLPIRAWSTSFVAAVRFVSTAGYAQRFVLWADPNAVLWYPQYNGELLGPNAIIEIWNNSSSTTPTLSGAVLIGCSWLNYPQYFVQGCDPTPGQTYPLVLVAPTSLPIGAYANPFSATLVN